MLLSKDLAAQLEAPTHRDLECVPGLDCDVRIRSLNGVERLSYFAKAANVDDEDAVGSGIRLMAHLVALSVVDENGERIYSDDDVDRVLNLNLKGIRHLAFAAADLNGLSLEESEEN